MVTLRSCFPMLPHCLPAGNSCQQQLLDAAALSPRRELRPATSSRRHFAAAPLLATALSQRPGQQYLPDGAPPRRPCQQQLCHGAPGQQYLPNGSSPRRLCQQQLCHGTPASNKPHPAEKSTPVWLAIWHTWVGFANSQHRDAAFATPDNICAHSSLLLH